MNNQFSKIVEELRKNGTICFQIATLADSIETEEQELLLNLFKETKFTKNAQKEIAEWLKDIIKMDNSIPDIFMEARVVEITQDENLNTPQKADKIKKAFHKIRFPKINEFLIKEESLRKKVILPETSKLTSITPLEEGEFKLEFKFDSLDSLTNALNFLQNKTLLSKELKDLFNHMEKDI